MSGLPMGRQTLGWETLVRKVGEAASSLAAGGFAFTASLAIAYGLFLVAYPLRSLDPGALTFTEAMAQGVLPVVLAVVGFMAVLAITHMVFNRAGTGLLAMLPGAAASLLLAIMIIAETSSLASPLT